MLVRRQSRASCKSVAGVSGGYSQARTSKAPETGRSRNLLGSTPKSIRRASEGHPKGIRRVCPAFWGKKRTRSGNPPNPVPNPTPLYHTFPIPVRLHCARRFIAHPPGTGAGLAGGHLRQRARRVPGRIRSVPPGSGPSNPKTEGRNPKEIRIPKPEAPLTMARQQPAAARLGSDCEFRSSFGFWAAQTGGANPAYPDA